MAKTEHVTEQVFGPERSLSSASAGGKPGVFLRLDQTASYPYPFSWYVRKALWMMVQGTVFRFSPARVNGWRRMWLKMFGAKVAGTAVIRPTAQIRHPWLLEMGEFSCLAENVHIYNLGPVSIGDHTVISQNTHVCNGTHDYTKPNLPLQRPTCKIGSGVWICADAFIGPGVTIGDNVIVAARGVVTKDVAAATIVGGNPAKFIKARPMGAGGSV
jgi:putative colanic acid biosynthesis acetyltransferase WcaF